MMRNLFCANPLFMIQKYPNYGQCGRGRGAPTYLYDVVSIPLAQAMPIIKNFQEKGALGITLKQKLQLFAEYKLPFH